MLVVLENGRDFFHVGESIPVYKSAGSKVFSGTLIVQGALPSVEVSGYTAND